MDSNVEKISLENLLIPDNIKVTIVKELPIIKADRFRVQQLFQNVISNAHFIIELLDIVLKNSLMSFDKEYFQQIFGIIMGTNLAPILANLYLALLQNELKNKCVHDKKIKMAYPIPKIY